MVKVKKITQTYKNYIYPTCCINILHSLQEHELGFHCLISSLNFFKEPFPLIFDDIDSHILAPKYVKLSNR